MTSFSGANLIQLGFRFDRGGAHTARTMMLQELEALLAHVDRVEATSADYLRAIDEENCLRKRSQKTRVLTYRHLRELYALDPSVLIFRALLFFWQRDTAARPLLALLCAYARDSVLRSTAPVILAQPEGATITRESVEAFIDDLEPGRFSSATLKSVAQNVNSSWTQAGHLTGKVRKIRSRPSPTAGSAAFALLLGYLTGARGQTLFCTEYAKLLGCSKDRTMELAEEASRRGWIVVKRLGDVVEVLFPNLLTAEDLECLREQS